MQKLLILLPLLLTISDTSASQVPCSFPSECSCTLSGSGSILQCVSMERCLNQQSMDAIASGIRSDACRVTQLIIGCTSGLKPWPAVKIESSLFRHINWNPLELLQFGYGCHYQFEQQKLLALLPNLEELNILSAKLSTNLSQFSHIFCCPRKLAKIEFKELGAEEQGSLIERKSFINFPAISHIAIISSPNIFENIDWVFNTSSPSMEILYKNGLPVECRNFSNLSFTNLVGHTKLTLYITNIKGKFSIDGPANIVGFEVTRIAISNTKVTHIGASPFHNLQLKDVSITGAGLDGNLLHNLLRALSNVSRPELLGTLSVEFKQKTQTFPFDEFNALCHSLSRLHRLSISQSPISFSNPPGRHFECPQMLKLSLTNCNLRNSDLPSDAFSQMPNLTHVKLDSNLFYSFPTEIFNFTNQVVYLSITGNSRMDFKASSLWGILPNLNDLSLSHCGISEPLTDAFTDQPQLTTLDLSSLQTLSKVQSPCKTTWFRNCTMLKRLNLGSNSKLFGTNRCDAFGFFDPLINLETLILSHSNFGSQKGDTVRQLLTKLSSLKNLILDDNNVKLLEFFLSSPLPELQSISLTSNSLSGIPRDLLYKMTPKLQKIVLIRNAISYLDPETFSRMPNLRLKLGPGNFACNCDLVPFTNWLRLQWPVYQVETIESWLFNAICYTMPNGSRANTTVRLLDFNMSWWDCYSRRLIVFLVSSIGALIVIFGIISLLVRYRWKLHYSLLSFCIRHHLVKRNVPIEWTYDGCFIYDETDERVSQWVEHLIHKLETDLQLRLYEPQRDAPAGANILDEAACAIDKSRHAVLVLTRGFLENRLNLYSAQWSNESLFMRRRSLAVMVMRESLSESDLRIPGCKVLHRLYRMCKPDWIIDCSGCGIGSNSANRLGLMLYKGARIKYVNDQESETEPLLVND